MIKYRLEAMGERHQFRQSKGRSATLDRVDCPEHTMDNLFIIRRRLHLAQARGKHLKKFVAFDEEHVSEFVQFGHCSSAPERDR